MGDTKHVNKHISSTAALRAGSYLAQNNAKLQRSFDRLSSGQEALEPVDNPGGLAVSMKLNASINRLAGAQNNVQNATSFLEVQDGMLDSVGKIVDRMSELKGLASQDPMKGEQDRASYNNEFKDLQVQLYSISQQQFNGVSLFGNHTTNSDGVNTSTEVQFNGKDTLRTLDNTLTIFTSAEGSGGSKVSVYKSALLSALTLGGDKSINKTWGTTTNSSAAVGPANQLTFASANIEDTLDLDQLSVGVITQALENISYLRAQNGGSLHDWHLILSR